jgi:antitoxin component YwqK of YwqJK toxin-antitoxin module
MRILFTYCTVVISLTMASAQDTLTVHSVKLVAENGIYQADGITVSVDIYKKIEAEQVAFKAKSLNRVCWVRRLDKNNRMVEQGLFCNGTTPLGNVFRYDSKGQVRYKKLYTGTKLTTCGQSEIGTKAVEEIYDFTKGLRIYATYLDGQKHGQFIYYEKGDIVGVEAYEKGKLLKRTGRIFAVNEDGSFALAMVVRN